MPIAEIELPDGRIAEVEVPAGMSNEQMQASLDDMWRSGAFKQAGESGDEVQPEAQDSDSLAEQYDQESDAENSILNKKTRGRASSVLNGALLGWGNEAAAGIGGLIGATQGYGEGEGYWDRVGNIYDDIKGAEKERQDAYTKAHPIESGALDVAGSLLSAPLTMGAKAVQTGQKATGIGANVLRKAAQYGKGAGKLATEGAIAGAGNADDGDRLAGATMGAGTSMALGGLLRGGRDLTSGLTSRKVARDLGYGEDFVPINVADEAGAGLQTFYQNTMGNTLGKAGVINPTKKLITKAEHRVKKINEEATENLFKRSLPKTMRESDIDWNNLDKTTAQIQDEWSSNSAFKTVKDKTFNVNDKELLDSIAADITDPALARNKGTVMKDVKEAVGDRMKRDELWDGRYKSSGVGVVKTDLIPQNTGTIKGVDLMDARNSLRTKINELKNTEGDTSLHRGVLSKSVAKIDELIMNQLPDSAKKSYKEELDAYGVSKVLKKTMEKVNKQNMEAPDAKTIAKAAMENNPNMVSSLRGTMQKQAYDDSMNAKSAKAAEDLIRSRMPNEAPLANQLYQTKALAPVMPSAASKTLGGAVGALGATTQTGQRFVAGQTPTQQAIQEKIQSYRNSKLNPAMEETIKALRRQTAAATGGD